jgi:hypothetical protein
VVNDFHEEQGGLEYDWNKSCVVIILSRLILKVNLLCIVFALYLYCLLDITRVTVI